MKKVRAKKENSDRVRWVVAERLGFPWGHWYAAESGSWMEESIKKAKFFESFSEALKALEERHRINGYYRNKDMHDRRWKCVKIIPVLLKD